MLIVNDQKVNIEHFPDGTQRLNIFVRTKSLAGNHIIWKFESEEECMTLWFIVNHMRDKYPYGFIYLTLPYVPNARYDRIKEPVEVFTLKYFAKFINSLNFTKVIILDPHSNVTPALLNNVEIQYPTKNIQCVIDTIINAGYTPILYFPDEGAMKRYQGMFSDYPFLYGEKKRDWKTGVIEGLELRGDIDFIKNIDEPDFLMIDDICSYGGTFYYSAKKLKEEFPNCYINSWATHTENNFPTLQKAFDEGLILNHFTTDSLYKQDHSNIKTFTAC